MRKLSRKGGKGKDGAAIPQLLLNPRENAHLPVHLPDGGSSGRDARTMWLLAVPGPGLLLCRPHLAVFHE